MSLDAEFLAVLARGIGLKAQSSTLSLSFLFDQPPRTRLWQLFINRQPDSHRDTVHHRRQTPRGVLRRATIKDGRPGSARTEDDCKLVEGETAG